MLFTVFGQFIIVKSETSFWTRITKKKELLRMPIADIKCLEFYESQKIILISFKTIKETHKQRYEPTEFGKKPEFSLFMNDLNRMGFYIYQYFRSMHISAMIGYIIITIGIIILVASGGQEGGCAIGVVAGVLFLFLIGYVQSCA